MDFSHLTQGLDLPRNAFLQQHLLDLYGGAGGDPAAPPTDPALFDWGGDVSKLFEYPSFAAHHPPGDHGLPSVPPTAPLPGGPGAFHPRIAGFPANPAFHPAAAPGFLSLPGTEMKQPIAPLARAGQHTPQLSRNSSPALTAHPSPMLSGPSPLQNPMSVPYMAGTPQIKPADTGSEKDLAKPAKRKASRKAKPEGGAATQHGKEKQFYNYYHTTYSLRQYLADNLSDQQVDDLEEMAKCIYEAQLEALLPLDYKDLCFLEEVVTRQAQFYETFLDMAGTPGAVWRRTGDILCCNDNFAELLKSTREELVGVNIVKLAAPEALYDAVKLYILKLSLPGLPKQLVSDTALLRRADNQRLYFRAFVTIVHNMYQMPSVLVGLFFPYPTPGITSENVMILP